MKLPVVLVHGWGGSFATDWVRTGVVASLGERGRTMPRIDILGHGEAEKPTDPLAYADLAGHIASQLPHGPAMGMGFSLGAKLLLELAARFPLAFQSLVLVGVGANVFRPEASAAATLAALDARERGHPQPDALADYAVANGSTPGSVAACLRRPHNPLITAERLAAVRVPVLLVAGDTDRVAQPIEPLLDALPAAELVTLRGAGHLDLLGDACLPGLAAAFFDAAEQSHGRLRTHAAVAR